MDLNKEQVSEYGEKGWIVLPQLFSKEEVSILESAAMDVLQRPGPEVARELNGDPHVCWGMHLFDEPLFCTYPTSKSFTPCRAIDA